MNKLSCIGECKFTDDGICRFKQWIESIFAALMRWSQTLVTVLSICCEHCEPIIKFGNKSHCL